MKTTDTLRLESSLRLDRRVSNQILARYGDQVPESLLHRALAEARARAWETGWPMLVFPLLAEETIDHVLKAAAVSSLMVAQAA
jgi:uncharacterized protein (DUF1810 family)